MSSLWEGDRMNWEEVLKENYHAENAMWRRHYANDAANRLPDYAAWPDKFDKAFKQFSSLISEYMSSDEHEENEVVTKLNEIRKLALEEWEKTVSQQVQLIEEAGSEKAKAKLKENRHWMRGGTIRTQEEIYASKTKNT
tara:strand:- start:39 stop:455 length:417 start_codon:yes stop_codon:yes gene_type:complete